MTPKFNLDLMEQRKAMLHAHSAPSARVHAASFTHSADRDRTAGAPQPVDHHDDDDNLLAARGILAATVLSIGFWLVIGLIVWFIAR